MLYTIVSTLCVLTDSIQANGIGSIIIPALQMRILNHREVKQLPK